ncbi:tetratricopeptide repeat protein [Cardinium endosymbiont of Bemisia tabaci]|uniref:tetratricopeptide repeat protein n=1 Tax=Cardinium endosymbiont of Bemisia tabaci TaxID=672794 RepID=UPI000442D20A|nr:tetratricopeptide repeat protein [Cardinium endosymbiont of Bemisia tabaci]CDG49999.1 TPR domain-containing protein [Cardinium endosymbiont cBtQ1 of Bemisia tabaci]
MDKKYRMILYKVGRYRFSCVLVWLVIPHSLLAIPPSIAQILRTFEGQNKQKSAKPKHSEVPSPSVDDTDNNPPSDQATALSNVQQARLAIDAAIKDSKLAGHPATWYYRGVIYDRLLRDHVASEEAPALLDQALTAYAQAQQLSVSKHKQFHSFSVGNLTALWSYFLNRGIGYYRQEAFDQAIEQFAICRRILSKETTPLLYMAIAYHSHDKPEEALRYYQDYLRVEGPHFAVLRAIAAIHYYKLKNFDTAIAILNEALLQFPFNNELLEEKCCIYDAAGKLDSYADGLAVGLQNKEIHAYYAYAYLLEYQGRIEEAVFYYKKVLKDQPHQYDALCQIGFVFYNKAIKLHSDTVQLFGQKEPLAHPRLTDWYGLIHVTLSYTLPDGMGSVSHHGIWPIFNVRRWLSKPLLFARPTCVVYDYQLVQHSKINILNLLLKTGHISYTSPLYSYINQKKAAILACNQWAQRVSKLEKYLKKSMDYLKIARRQDKKDQAVGQALYYSYYYLKKYRSAYSLLQAMHKKKQYLSDDPFFTHKEKN